MPIFFMVGGYGNAASWRSSVAKGIGYGDWVRARARRLLRPTIVFVAAGVALAVAVGLTGLVEPSVLAEATQAIVIPVWFLTVYMLVVAAAPAMLVLHERFRLAAPLVLVAVIVAFDVLGRGLGLTFFGWANFIPVWLAVHQLGFYSHDGSLKKIRRYTTAIAGVLLVAITALTFFGPYPVAMVGVKAADGSNNTPPTVLMVVLALAQLAVALRLEARAQRMLAKPRVWTAVVASGGIAMTVYLWHMTAMILVIGALWSTNSSLLGIDPMSTLWFITRPLFLGMVVVALIPFVAAFRSVNRPSPATLINLPTVRAIAGCALAGIGLARFAFFGLYWPSGPLGHSPHRNCRSRERRPSAVTAAATGIPNARHVVIGRHQAGARISGSSPKRVYQTRLIGAGCRSRSGESVDENLHNGAGHTRLPFLVGVLGVDRPLDFEVDASLRPGGRSQQLNGRPEYGQLHRLIVGNAERLAERELHPHDARGSVLGGHVRHHGDRHRRYPGPFDETCQHGHVATAIRSGRSEHHRVYMGLVKALDHIRPVSATPLGEVAGLIAHERVVLCCRGSDAP